MPHNISVNTPQNIRQKIVVFYHHPCLDGSAAAWAAVKKFGDEAFFKGVDHNDYTPLKNILPSLSGKTVYFVDFAPTEEVLTAVLNDAKKVIIYDHHLSSFKELGCFDHPNCEIYFDMRKSGAGLTWDMLHGKRSFLVDIIEDIDIFNIDKYASEEEFFTFAAGMDAFDLMDLEHACLQFDKIEQSGRDFVYKRGLAQRKIYLKRIEEVFKHFTFIQPELESVETGEKIGFIWANMHVMGREFSTQLYTLFDAEEAIVFVCNKQKDGVKISLRSVGDKDVSLIAKELAEKYGLNGGGHKNASAAYFSFEQFKVLEKLWTLPRV